MGVVDDEEDVDVPIVADLEGGVLFDDLIRLDGCDGAIGASQEGKKDGGKPE
jgi:hypothetical protein